MNARQRARSAHFLFPYARSTPCLRENRGLPVHRLTRCIIGYWRHTAGNEPVMNRHPIQGKFWRVKG